MAQKIARKARLTLLPLQLFRMIPMMLICGLGFGASIHYGFDLDISILDVIRRHLEMTDISPKNKDLTVTKRQRKLDHQLVAR